MISYNKKFGFFNVTENWFAYRFHIGNIFTLNRFLHVKIKNDRFIAAVKKITHTVELSLNPDVEALQNNFSTTIRQEIRKAKAEGISCEYDNGKLAFFVEFYNQFAKEKGIYTTTPERVAAMGENFHLSFASFENEIIVSHSYLVDKELKIARLFHSANRRLDEKYDRKMIGRANKLLTFEDIIHFKNMGIETLDFGGFANNTEDKSLKGINDFKLSFGGKVVECHDYDSLPYFIVKSIFEILKRKKK